MKKTLFFVLIICICVVLISCHESEQYEETDTLNTSDPQLDNDQTEPNNDTPSTEDLGETETEAHSNNNTDVSGDVSSLHIQNFEEYQKFLKSSQNSHFLSDKFVSYDKLSMFGEFDGMVFLHDLSYETEFYRYMYNFLIHDRFDFSLYVYENGKTYETSLPELTDVNVNDLRQVELESNGYFVSNGFTYTFIQGKLSSVRWTSNGIDYVFACVGYADFYDYPIETNDIISKILTSQYDDLAEIAIFKDAVAEK